MADTTAPPQDVQQRIARLEAVIDYLLLQRNPPPTEGKQSRAPDPGVDVSAGLPVDLVEIGRAAQIAGVSKPTMRRWCARHRLGLHPSGFAVRVGARWRISRKHLRDFIERDSTMSDLSD